MFWPKLLCLDNPEKITLNPGETINDGKLLWIGAYLKTNKKTEEEILAWK